MNHSFENYETQRGFALLWLRFRLHSAKISALLPIRIEKCEYVTFKKVPSDESRIVEQAKDQGRKQIVVIINLKERRVDLINRDGKNLSH